MHTTQKYYLLIQLDDWMAYDEGALKSIEGNDCLELFETVDEAMDRARRMVSETDPSVPYTLVWRHGNNGNLIATVQYETNISGLIIKPIEVCPRPKPRTFTFKADAFLDMVVEFARQHGKFNKGVGNPADPTEWQKFECYIKRSGVGPMNEQVYRLEIHRCWGTHITLTWLAPQCPEHHPRYRKYNKRDRVKIDAYYDADFDKDLQHSDPRPLKQEHADLLLDYMTDPNYTTWHSKRPDTAEEELLAAWDDPEALAVLGFDPQHAERMAGWDPNP